MIQVQETEWARICVALRGNADKTYPFFLIGLTKEEAIFLEKTLSDRELTMSGDDDALANEIMARLRQTKDLNFGKKLFE